jgi:hypothetical protein
VNCQAKEIEMSRVWKRFFNKMLKGIAFITYLFASMIIPGAIAYWLGFEPAMGILLGLTVFILLPMFVFMVRDVYRDSKREIEWENRKMMSDLGKKY